MLFKLTSSSTVSSLPRSTFILNERDRKHSSQLFTTLGPPGAIVCDLVLIDDWDAEWRSFRERLRLWGNTTNSATLKMNMELVLKFRFFFVNSFWCYWKPKQFGIPDSGLVDIPVKYVDIRLECNVYLERIHGIIEHLHDASIGIILSIKS